jgi:hypothetical protein
MIFNLYNIQYSSAISQWATVRYIVNYIFEIVFLYTGTVILIYPQFPQGVFYY